MARYATVIKRLIVEIQRTQATDMGFNNIGFGIKMKIPDVFKQPGASYNLSGMTNQILKQAKLGWLKIKANGLTR